MWQCSPEKLLWSLLFLFSLSICPAYSVLLHLNDLEFLCSASLARRLYIRKGTGVGAFGKVYGDKKRRGTLPGHFCKASRGVIRGCLIQLEKVRFSSPHILRRTCGACSLHSLWQAGSREHSRCSSDGAVVEQIGVVSKCEKGGGREISLQGRQDCDRIATEVYNSKQ